MSVIIISACRSGHEGDVAIDVQVRMRQINPGVDDGDVGIHPLVDAVNSGGGRDVGADAADAWWNNLAEGIHLNILLNELDARILLQCVQPAFGDRSSEAIQGMLELMARGESILLGNFLTAGGRF